MKSSKTGFAGQRGISLLELLVAIGVILVLSGLLLVGIHRMRSVSDSTVCLSNLRHLGVAHAIYRSENNGYFVPYTRQHGSESSAGNSANQPWPQVFIAKGYVESDGNAYSCPALQENEGFLPHQNSSRSFRYTYIHYGYNYQHIGGSTRYKNQYPPAIEGHPETDPTYIPAHENQITHPENTLLLVDTFRHSSPNDDLRGRYIVRDTPGGNDYQIHPRHNQGMNILYVNGRVTRVFPKDIHDPWRELGHGIHTPSAFRR